MEAVGARLGRSSTRYGPATVFSGPVRKWKKRWVPLSSSSPSSNPNPHSSSNNNNNASHLLLYKWTPLSHSSSNNSNAAKDDASAAPDEPPRRKFRYVPVSVIEEQKKEASEQVDDETKPSDNAAKDSSPVTSKDTDTDGKPDVNDVLVKETQCSDKDQAEPQLNETNLDLSLGLKAHDGDYSTDKSEGSILERGSSGGDVEMRSVQNPEPEIRNKRKSNAPDLEMRV
eukprot:TRINITY_DN3363_c0_g1_i1.p1 TRINITY_DN3363_c0_g1~~TRINITY_DN3363_c0_g1_i1.p1  ORF type:complete len:228 (-),score=69.06 TRINITY_DN3363_c0_g1_i1:320-1003(-)